MPKLPKILVIGGTGTVGRAVVEELETFPKELVVRYSSRRPEQIAEWGKKGRDAVLLDLDDPTTFPLALHGVDRIMLITGYSVAMLTQSKTVVDAAKKAGVQHIVHLGVYAQWDVTDPHFVWHVMVESYIAASGIPWTNVHPNVFLENLFAPNFLSGSTVLDYMGGNRVGWVAGETISNVAATVLREGPEKHHSKDYFLSTEVFTPQETARILGEELGKKITVANKTVQDFIAMVDSSPVWNEKWYATRAAIFMKQVQDGTMGYIGTFRDDGPFVTGKASLTFREWIVKHKSELLKYIGPN